MDSARPSVLPLVVPGDASASARAELAALFEVWHVPLLRYLRSFGLDAPDCEEVAQEVFLALARHVHLGRSRKNLPGWIFRVGHNLALKRRATRAAAVIRDAVSESRDPAPSPEQRAVWVQRGQRLRAILAALPEQDRHCVLLRSEGLRYREIASVLGISLGSVANSLARALERLACVEDQ